MTEDEAKTKACCGPRNNGSSGDDDILCIGSACMAWRRPRYLTQTPPGADLSGDGWKVVRSIDPDGPAPMIEWEKLGPGFCGLAGAPQ